MDGPIYEKREDNIEFIFFLVRAKMTVVKIAKERQASMKNEWINVLNIFYLGSLESIKMVMNPFWTFLKSIKI